MAPAVERNASAALPLSLQSSTSLLRQSPIRQCVTGRSPATSADVGGFQREVSLSLLVCSREFMSAIVAKFRIGLILGRTMTASLWGAKWLSAVVAKFRIHVIRVSARITFD